MTRSAEVCVLGSLNMDLVARVTSHPRPGETVTSRAYDTVPGGKGANQAVAAARLGAKTALIGRVGADAHGSSLLARMQDEGVDASNVTVDPSAATGLAFVVVDAAGQNMIILVPGANARVADADIAAAEETITGARVLIVQMEMDAAVAARALSMARSRGVRTILNQAPALPLDPAALRSVDLLIVNETEAETLAGTPAGDADTARQAATILAASGPECVIVTLGARGAVVHGPGLAEVVPAIPVTVVDTTAAGDAFVAAVAVAWGRTSSLVDAAHYAARASAIAVSRSGAQPSLPTADEVAALEPAEEAP